MKRWSLVAIGLVAYALGVITTAPATLIDAGLQRISHGKLRLVEAQGTLLRLIAVERSAGSFELQLK